MKEKKIMVHISATSVQWEFDGYENVIIKIHNAMWYSYFNSVK